jgi:hypothetical protein
MTYAYPAREFAVGTQISKQRSRHDWKFLVKYIDIWYAFGYQDWVRLWFHHEIK